MADLSTLDDTIPPNSELSTTGAQRIRETRDAILTSFGVEHHLTGEHAFLFGNTASRPALGKAGRFYINTELGRLEYDTGSAWVAVPIELVVGQTIAAEVSIAGVTGLSLIAGAGQANWALLPAITLSGGTVLFGGSLSGVWIGSASGVVIVRLIQGAVELFKTSYSLQSVGGTSTLPIPCPSFRATIAASIQTYKVTVEVTGSGSFNTHASSAGHYFVTETR